MSTKTATIYVRVEPEVKEQTEEVLDRVGLSLSDAVNLFCKQVIFQNGIPFDLKAGAPSHLDTTNWTNERLNSEIGKGLVSIKDGKAISLEKSYQNFRKRHAIHD